MLNIASFKQIRRGVSLQIYHEFSNWREIVESVDRVEGKSISFKSHVTVTDDTSAPDGY